MRLKMLCSLYGPDVSLNAGDEGNFPDGEAKRLIEAGFAIPVAEKKMERAVKKRPAKETRKK